MLPLYAEWLCSGSSSGDARATRLVNGMHTYLVPTMNPDGFQAMRRANR